MPSYSEFRDTIEKVRTLLVKETIKPIAFEAYEQERGTPVRQVLPGDNEEWEFSVGEFSGLVDTESRSLYNPQYKGELLTLNLIANDPNRLYDIGSAVYDVWEDVFGENIHGANQPDHPGEPPFSATGMEHTIDGLVEQWELLCADPRLDDLIGAIRDRNYRLAIRFLGADNPNLVLDPTSGHELYNLFTSGEVHIVYEDDEIALLKPEYNLDGDEELMRQQWNAQLADNSSVVRANERFGEFMPDRLADFEQRDDVTVIEGGGGFGGEIIRGEWPQEAFVVGRDDTPVGLFVHSIDGTRLDPSQNVSREYIQDVMGFDRSYRHEERLDMNVGERVRMQGDLAIEYVSGESVSDAGRCPVPIDNHYAALDKGVLAPGEDKSVEPIRVRVPDGAYLNIAHDEHENVAVELAGGEYEFYLLTRGLQTQDERPSWSQEEMEETARLT